MKLRNLKFDLELGSYNEVFELVFEQLSEKLVSLEDYARQTILDDYDNSDTVRTIVVNKDIHRKLSYLKMLHMREIGATARGSGSVSISQMVEKLIRKFEEI